MFNCVKCIYEKICIEIDISIECQPEDHEKRFGGWELLQYLKNLRLYSLRRIKGPSLM